MLQNSENKSKKRTKTATYNQILEVIHVTEGTNIHRTQYMQSSARNEKATIAGQTRALHRLRILLVRPAGNT